METPLGVWLPPTPPKTLYITYIGSTRNGNGDYVINLLITSAGIRGQTARVALMLENALAQLPGAYSLPVDNRRSLVLAKDRTDFALPVSLVRLPAVLGPPATRLTVQIEVAGLVAFSQAFTLAEAVNKSAECDCGKGVGAVFRCEDYKPKSVTIYGPLYGGQLAFKNFLGWDELIAARDATEDERAIISAVAPNEGNFDAVQSWDTQIVSVGAMQKAISPTSYRTG